MKSKIIFKIVLVILTYICLTFLRHIFAMNLLYIFTIDKTFSNRFITLIIVDFLTYLIIYLSYLKLKSNNIYIKLIVLTSIFFPVLNELDLLTTYTFFNFNVKQLCFVHYNHKSLLFLYIPLLIISSSISLLIYKKRKVFKKDYLKYIFLVVLCFIVLNKIVLKIFS